MTSTDRIREISATLRTKVERLRADSDYTQEYKTQRLAAAYLAAREEMAQVRAGHEHAVRTSKIRAEQALLGLGGQADGSQVIAFRDALDRAGQLQDPVEALTALRRAVSCGDGQLSAAIARQARSRGWGEVAAEWVSGAGPSVQRHLDDLAEADEDARYWNSPQGKLTASALFRVEAPDELAGMDDRQVEQAAGPWRV